MPSNRLKTQYIYNNGFDGDFGFKDDPLAKQINWIITSRTAPTAIVRYDDWKAFSPADDDCADNWRLLTTMYHDLWINDCDKETLWVNTK